MKKNIIFFFLTALIISFTKLAYSEPFVVLEYRGNSHHSSLNSDNVFLQNLMMRFISAIWMIIRQNNLKQKGEWMKHLKSVKNTLQQTVKKEE